ncbi:MAG: metallophosphoesterase [Cytophagaceae bacterium]|jgi:hypothetical protein|nr:metallophosphoesterase [Cytophagaceae bacterium]
MQQNRLLFFGIITSVIFLIDWYAFQGIKELISGFGVTTRRVLTIVYWGFTVCSLLLALGIGTGVLERSGGVPRMITMGMFMTIFVTKLVFILFVATDDVIRLMRWAYQSLFPSMNAAQDVSRLKFLLKIGAGVASIPFVGMTWGVVNGAHDYRIRRERIALPNLPGSFKGLKIAQLSDVHAGSFYNKAAVQRGIDMLMEQKPDVIFFTGDLVNNVASEMLEYKELFAQLKAPMGVYSTLGNHDYGDYVPWESLEEKQKNLQQLMQIHKEMGWDLLMNEHRVLEKNGEKIAVIGIENWGAKGRFPKYGKLHKAYAGTQEYPVKLLLSHDPSHWDAQVRKDYPDIDIMFAGHTHGMQFGVENTIVKWSPVKYMYQQWAGLYAEGNQYLYVNRGFGFIGFPGRVGIWPEIAMIELV